MPTQNRILVLALGCVVSAFVSGGLSSAADKNVDLDRSATTGNESTVSTSVVTTSPVKIRNKVTNRAVGQAFRFNWPSAGPGGFISEAGTPARPGTAAGVGATWTWDTLQQVFSFTGNSCTNDICFTRTNPAGSSFGSFGVPGRSLSSSGVTVTNASLTSSLLTFFSPEIEVFHVTSSIQQLAGGLFCYRTSVTNNTTGELTYREEPAPLGCDSFCGDGVREGVEDCDGSDLSEASCDSQGRTGTGLTCSPQCTFDVSGCGTPECGNGVQEGYEGCDGSDFGGYSCGTIGGSGSLSCNKFCQFDFTTCSNVCGNGIAEEGEDCDGSDLNGQECNGSLGCNPDCSYDVSNCSDVCGNGVRDGKEYCDGSDLGGGTCRNVTETRDGTLGCNGNCTYDTSGCTCGNGVRDGDDQCDGTDFGGLTCGSFGGGTGFVEGGRGFGNPDALNCTSGCQIDLSGCTDVCGNGVRDGGEQCEGSDLGGATCTSVGGTGGTLACNQKCTYDTSACSGVCGNGVQEGAEECDGYDFGGEQCGPSKLEGRTGADGGGNGLEEKMREKIAEATGRGIAGALGSATARATGAAAGPRTLTRPEASGMALGSRPGLTPAGQRNAPTRVAGATFGESSGYLVCDSSCRTDRSNCDTPCDTQGRDVTIPVGTTTVSTETSVHPGKEVNGAVTVCGPGVPDGAPLCGGSDPATQGTANKLVPNEDLTVTGHPFPVVINVVVVDGNNGILEPGETANVFIYLNNAGTVGLTGVHGSLSYIDADVDRNGSLDPITITQGESDYPDGPCMAGTPSGSGDCDSPAPAIPTCANITPFVVSVPAGHPVDVSRVFELFITGNSAVARGFGVSFNGSLNLTTGIGGPACGNGIVEAGEQCDAPGNVCCSPVCTFATGACDDNNKCTAGDTCVSGACAPGAPVTCDDHNPCTSDTCSPTATGDGCVYTNTSGPCPGGTCQGGSCVATSTQCPIGIVEADAWVKKSSPTSNYGKKVEFEADKPPYENQSLLRIRVSGVGAGRTLSGGSLRLFPLDSSSSGGRLREVACGWSETGATWNNTRSLLVNAPFTTKGAIVKNRRTEFNLTSALQGDGDGTYCYLMDNPTGEAEYASREAAAGRPDVTLTTNPPCVPITTTDKADATVVSNAASTNFGGASTLGVDGSPTKYTFVRFEVAGVNGRTVTSARLRLQVANVSGSDSDKGGSIKLLTSAQCGSWTEGGIKYSNKPSPTGSSLSSVSSVRAGQIVEWDLKTTVPGDGTYCYRLESSSGDGADYNSKEGAVLMPELVLTIAP